MGFPGNEVADSFAKYTAYACCVTLTHRQPPARYSVTFQGNLWHHKFSGAARRRLYPRHQHTAIATPLSFDWSSHYSWFSAFADKWVMGVKGSKGSAPYWELPGRQCPHCDDVHPLDLPSCVASFATFRPFLHQMADAWGFALAPVVHSWLQDRVRTKGSYGILRTLVPLTLYKQLVPHPSQKSVLREALPPRRPRLNSIVKAVCTARRDHPLPEPLPPPLGANHFFVSHGPYSTSDGPPPTPQHLYRPPPPVPTSVTLKAPARRGTKRNAPACPGHSSAPRKNKKDSRRLSSVTSFLRPGNR